MNNFFLLYVTSTVDIFLDITEYVLDVCGFLIV